MLRWYSLSRRPSQSEVGLLSIVDVYRIERANKSSCCATLEFIDGYGVKVFSTCDMRREQADLAALFACMGDLQ